MPNSSAVQSYINAIRFFINDDAQLNVLLGLEESSDEKIAFCMMMVVDDFNASNPVNDEFIIETFPNFTLLINGTVIKLLISAGILQSRNQINYQAGGLSVQLWNKDRQYQVWIQQLQAEYQANKMSLIRKANISRAMRQQPCGLHSNYWLMSFTNLGIS
jgi:hypothetical protein